MPTNGLKKELVEMKLDKLEKTVEGLAKKVNTYQIYNKEELITILQEALKSNERDNKLNTIINLIWVAIVMAIFGIASLWLLAK